MHCNGCPSASTELHIGRVLAARSIHVEVLACRPSSLEPSVHSERIVGWWLIRHSASGDKSPRPESLVVTPPLAGKPHKPLQAPYAPIINLQIRKVLPDAVELILWRLMTSLTHVVACQVCTELKAR